MAMAPTAVISGVPQLQGIISTAFGGASAEAVVGDWLSSLTGHEPGTSDRVVRCRCQPQPSRLWCSTQNIKQSLVEQWETVERVVLIATIGLAVTAATAWQQHRFILPFGFYLSLNREQTKGISAA